MDQRRISVVVPVRNGRPFIVEAVASALAQGRCVGEVVVVDDGSTDDTAAVVNAMGDCRVRLVANPGQGVWAARNHGVAIARQGWIAFLDAADRVGPDAYRRLRAAATPDCVVVYGDCDRIDAAGRRIGLRPLMPQRAKPHGDVLDPILRRNCVPLGAALIRREMVEAIGGFDGGFGRGEDWLLWCRLATQGPFIYVKLHVSDDRVHRPSPRPREAHSFATMEPLLERIFTDPLITAARDPDTLTACRPFAEASLHRDLTSEAVRRHDWRAVAGEIAAFARRSPRGLPRMTLTLAASVAGL